MIVNQLIMCDLDGSVCDNRHRQDAVPPKDQQDRVESWEPFNQLCDQDALIPHTASMLRGLAMSAPTHVAFVTGRPETVRSKSASWLDAHRDALGGGHYQSNPILAMRQVDDHRRAPEVKADLYSMVLFDKRKLLSEGNWNIIVIEDDPEVISMISNTFPDITLIQVPTRCAAVKLGGANK